MPSRFQRKCGVVLFLAGCFAAMAGISRPLNGAPPATRPAAGGTQLLVSATMHIESNRNSWPEPERLLAFFRRATAAGKSKSRDGGMHWSIGADIGWLRGEPRAGEIVKAIEALGVEWDVHAHRLEDRANVAAALLRLGGHPNRVASGLLVAEIDDLRKPIRGNDGATWQAEAAWGIAIRPLHGLGADDNSIGLWRPKSAADWQTDDPRGPLLAVGGGTRKPDDIEALAKRLTVEPGGEPRILSASLIVSPRTLLIARTGEDAIKSIEPWATRLAEMPVVRWATIRETADAWKAAGAVVSRQEK